VSGRAIGIVSRRSLFGALLADALCSEDAVVVASTAVAGLPRCDIVLVDADWAGAGAVLAEALEVAPTVGLLPHGSSRPVGEVPAGVRSWVQRHVSLEQLRGVLERDEDLGTVRAATTSRRAGADAMSLASLTARELEVLELVGDGIGTAEVAEVLGLSPLTVRTHVQNAMGKLGVKSRLEAVTTLRDLRQVSTGLPEVAPDEARRPSSDALTVVLGLPDGLEVEVVRAGLVALGFDVVGSAGDAQAVVALVQRLQPAVAVLAGELEGAVDACGVIKRGSETRVVVIDAAMDGGRLLSAVEAGADGFVGHGDAVADLAESIRSVHEGRAAVPPELLGGLLRSLIDRRREEDTTVERFSRLSIQERRVLRLLTEGSDQAAIATALFVSPHTVRTHIQNLIRKLEVHSRLEAVALVTRFGLLERFTREEES
jgi:DNA-binding NarL/FixJ family response regulator